MRLRAAATAAAFLLAVVHVETPARAASQARARRPASGQSAAVGARAAAVASPSARPTPSLPPPVPSLPAPPPRPASLALASAAPVSPAPALASAAPASAAPASPPKAAASRDAILFSPVRPPPTTARTLGIVAIATGVGSVAVGAVTGLLAAQRAKVVASQCDDLLRCSDVGVLAARDADTFATVSTVTFAAGATAVALGITLLVLAPRAASTRLTATPGPGRGAVGLAW